MHIILYYIFIYNILFEGCFGKDENERLKEEGEPGKDENERLKEEGGE